MTERLGAVCAFPAPRGPLPDGRRGQWYRLYRPDRPGTAELVHHLPAAPGTGARWIAVLGGPFLVIALG